jgi:hypothetical protein
MQPLRDAADGPHVGVHLGDEVARLDLLIGENGGVDALIASPAGDEICADAHPDGFGLHLRELGLPAPVPPV